MTWSSTPDNLKDIAQQEFPNPGSNIPLTASTSRQAGNFLHKFSNVAIDMMSWSDLKIILFIFCASLSFPSASASIGSGAPWKSKYIPIADLPKPVLESIRVGDLSKVGQVEYSSNETPAGKFEIYAFHSDAFCNQAEGCLHILYASSQNKESFKNRIVQIWCRDYVRQIPTLIRDPGDKAGAYVKFKTDCCTVYVGILRNGTITESLSKQGER